MKKTATWISAITIMILIIIWRVMDARIPDPGHALALEACIGVACYTILFACVIFHAFTEKCQQCGKIVTKKKKHCPYCGREI